eukprot:TRINITY_DN29528_c0_g1_i1.p1 TRINITY_DN29528_c0_g1~~TRINITY_DN29528_c0_g1_i1.p1  ORF type:complete len:121 (+),score=8.26 TRINITY_DN29528_c0_g1_i1:27-365(+)
MSASGVPEVGPKVGTTPVADINTSVHRTPLRTERYLPTTSLSRSVLPASLPRASYVRASPSPSVHYSPVNPNPPGSPYASMPRVTHSATTSTHIPSSGVQNALAIARRLSGE